MLTLYTALHHLNQPGIPCACHIPSWPAGALSSWACLALCGHCNHRAACMRFNVWLATSACTCSGHAKGSMCRAPCLCCPYQQSPLHHRPQLCPLHWQLPPCVAGAPLVVPCMLHVVWHGHAATVAGMDISSAACSLSSCGIKEHDTRASTAAMLR